MKKKIALIVAIASGVFAAVLTQVFINSKNAEVDALKNSINRRYGTMEVLCFVRELPGGTTLSKADLGIKSVPAIGMRGQALTVDNVADVVGRKTTISHRRGDVLFWSDVEGGNPAETGLSADIKKSMRAVSINCSGASSVSGMVKPNDHVDVIGTFDFEAKSGAKNFVTCTILQNVLVLATGQRTAKSRGANLTPGGASSYTTVTLEVTPREAEMLAFANEIKGRLMLSLRNRNDPSYEKELPKVDFDKIQSEIEELNLKRQSGKFTHR